MMGCSMLHGLWYGIGPRDIPVRRGFKGSSKTLQCLVFCAANGLFTDVQKSSRLGNAPVVVKEQAQDEALPLRQDVARDFDRFDGGWAGSVSGG